MSRIPEGWLLFKKGEKYTFVPEKVGLKRNEFATEHGEKLDKIPENTIMVYGDYEPELMQKGSETFEKARKKCNKKLHDEWLDATDGYYGAPGNCTNEDVREYMKKNNIKE